MTRSRVARPHFSREQLDRGGYPSQYGQDKWIAEVLLPGVRDGVFVDVGAHDGVSLSNTLYFERELGWKGLAIEPIPEVFDRLRANRSCQCAQACVSDTRGEGRLLVLTGYPEMLSGLVDEYDPRHRARIEKELREMGGTAREVCVPCYTLNELLSDHGIERIDYLNIDVEGAEWRVLAGFDFRRFPTRIIGIENNYGDPRFQRLLSAAGYTLRAVIGVDEFYVRPDLWSAMEDVIREE